MTKRHIYCMTIIFIVIILFLRLNLFVLQNKNTILKNELASTNANYALLVNTNLSISKELELVNNEFESVKNELESVKNELEDVKKENLQWSGKYNQYPVATIAWIYMTEELGWSEVVAAGIIGNMMAECGGHTLDLDWDVDSSNGYGLIQWIGGRRDRIKAKYGQIPTVMEQLEFMKDELYGTNGVTMQVTNDQLEAIMNAKTPEDCAFAFATYYERCSVEYREFRRGLARTAYNYFTTET